MLLFHFTKRKRQRIEIELNGLKEKTLFRYIDKDKEDEQLK